MYFGCDGDTGADVGGSALAEFDLREDERGEE